MRGSVPVVPAPDSPKTLEPRRPLGSPADVEEGELGPSSGKSKASSAKSLTSKNSVNAVRLGGLQHSSEESGDESCQRLLRKLSAMKATWVLVTLVVIILCGALAGPVVCKESAKCTEDHLKDQDLRFYSALIAAALASVLMQELASVILTNQAASRAVELIPDVKDSLIPSMLLCTTFIVLLVENLAFVIGEVPWYVHAANLGREDLDGQPVYSVFYAEWVINVPILLILAGSILPWDGHLLKLDSPCSSPMCTLSWLGWQISFPMCHFDTLLWQCFAGLGISFWFFLPKKVYSI